MARGATELDLWLDERRSSRRPDTVLPILEFCYVHHTSARFADLDLSRGQGQLGPGLYTWQVFEPEPRRVTRHRLEIRLTPRLASRLRTVFITGKADPGYRDLVLYRNLDMFQGRYGLGSSPHVDRFLAGADLVIAPAMSMWDGFLQAVFKPTENCRKVLAAATWTWSEVQPHR